MSQPSIVVVDDDDRITHLINDYLIEEGFKVFPAATSNEALINEILE